MGMKKHPGVSVEENAKRRCMDALNCVGSNRQPLTISKQWPNVTPPTAGMRAVSLLLRNWDT